MYNCTAGYWLIKGGFTQLVQALSLLLLVPEHQPLELLLLLERPSLSEFFLVEHFSSFLR